MEAPIIPDYIKRELSYIDRSYYFEWDKKSTGWFVRKKLSFHRNKVFVKNPVVGFYMDLDFAIVDLKKRKREGERLELDKHPERQLNAIKARNKEAKQKRLDANAEFMAKGLMFGHNMSIRKWFDIGASHAGK